LRDARRCAQTAQRLAPEVAAVRFRQPGDSSDPGDLVLDTEITDSQLRLMFACSHPALPMEVRLALTLKTLCGFGLTEVARALLSAEETVKKRITRAKQFLIEKNISLETPAADDLPARLETVHAVLYLMFNEGYSATASDEPIRRDLCEEAARLCHLLCEHRHCNRPATFALMALMLFHAARFDARLDAAGLVLLEEQDRSRWDYGLIKRALEFLKLATQGQEITAYHLEAGIAMYHCKGRSFADTDWGAILRHYDLLLQLQRSPVYLLNRAIALAHVEGPVPALQSLDEIRTHPQLKDYHLLHATLGELHRRAGNLDEARVNFQAAADRTQSPRERQLLQRRVALCGASQ
jgi:RNA polymerase sigma-70 factor (ECF subfamily)